MILSYVTYLHAYVLKTLLSLLSSLKRERICLSNLQCRPWKSRVNITLGQTGLFTWLI